MKLMKKLVHILGLIVSLSVVDCAYAVSLDSVYRDVVKSTNDGYLPVFVKNREAPSLKFDDSKFETYYEEDEEDADYEAFNFENDARLKKLAQIKMDDEWQNTVEAIQRRSVSPVDLERVKKRVAQKHPKAVEIYAWMYAKGVGVPKDLVSSYWLYIKADELGVEKAKENSRKVYNVMTKEQKQKIIYKQ